MSQKRREIVFIEIISMFQLQWSGYRRLEIIFDCENVKKEVYATNRDLQDVSLLIGATNMDDGVSNEYDACIFGCLCRLDGFEADEGEGVVVAALDVDILDDAEGSEAFLQGLFRSVELKVLYVDSSVL